MADAGGDFAAAWALLTTTERAALAYDWAGWWRRANQAAPLGPWRVFGMFGARGMGKTKAIAEVVDEEASSGRAMRIALIGMNEARTIEVMVHGGSGLLAVSRPWCRARFESGRVIWPNGAQAFIYTAERPGELFGPEHALGWASELHQWPRGKREEAMANLRMGLRIGAGRLVWDSNPAKRHPVLKDLLADAEAVPDANVVVRGSSWENVSNMTPGTVEDWERKYGGTQRGREMIYGEQSDEAEGALWQQHWIEANRRPLPLALKRRILSVDPAISTRAGTDDTGVVEAGLGLDEQVYAIADLTKAHTWEAWGELVVKRYFAGRCDCVVLERNRGGDACVANLRAAALKVGRDEGREIAVHVVKDDATTRHALSAIYVKEVIGRTSKGTRAEPVATHTEAGRVSFVEGAELGALEECLCSWVPDSGGESPNALDAFVWAVIELAGLSRAAKVDGAAAVSGAAAMIARVAEQTREPPRQNIAALLGGGGRGGGSSGRI